MANEPGTEQIPVIEAPVSEPAATVDPPAHAHCPNCNAPGIRRGKLITCQVCDASFRYTKEGPKVQELGPFDILEARVTQLESGRQFVLPEPAKPQPPEPAKPKPPKPHDDDGL